VLTSFPFLKI